MAGEDGLTRSVHRALLLLDCLADVEDGASIRDLSRRLELPKSTVQRLLASLEAEGLVHQHSDRGSYRLSAGIYRFVAKIHGRLDLRSQALPVMRQARDRSRQSVALMVREGDHRICVESLEGLDPLRGFVGLGDRLPLYSGASGKLLLAFAPGAEAEEMTAPARLVPLTRHTIVDSERLRSELELIRHQGYSTADQERYEGFCSVAAPIRDFSGQVVAALTIFGAQRPFTGESLSSMIEIVRASSAEISDRMGFESVEPSM